MPDFLFENKRVCYSDTGTGPALLLVPGLGGQLSFWNGVTEILKDSFRVVSFDHPGCGGSELPDGEVSIARLSALTITLLDHLNITSASVIGHSLGGAIAQTLALDYPERVQQLVLSSTWSQPDFYFERAFTQRAEMLRHGGIEAYIRAQTLAVMPPENIANHPDEVRHAEQIALTAMPTAEVLLARIAALLAFDRETDLHRISQPTLVVCASDDLVVPPHMSRKLASQIPGAQFIEFPRGGHFAPRQGAQDYAQLILPFLTGQTPAKPQVPILMIGCGAIGNHLRQSLANNPEFKLAAVLTAPGREEHYRNLLGPGVAIASSLQDLPPLPLAYAIECGGHAGLKAHGPDVLASGLDLGVLSSGSLVDLEFESRMRRAAQAGGAKIEILPGALSGLDALSAAKCAGLDQATLTTRKSPVSWKGTAAESILDLDRLSAPATLFEGNARQAAALYPKNANVAAAFALSGLGLDQTHVKLIADPNIQQNSHEISVNGAFGTFTSTVCANSLESNPKSSMLAALSAIQAVRRRFSGLSF